MPPFSSCAASRLPAHGLTYLRARKKIPVRDDSASSLRALPHIEIERESDPARVSLFTVNSSEHCCSGERCSCRVRDLGHPAMSDRCPDCSENGPRRLITACRMSANSERNRSQPCRGVWRKGQGNGRRGSVPASSQVVRIPGLQAGPLDDGTSIGTVRVLPFRPLWPAGRRVLPPLLPPVDRQVEQTVAVVHRLDAAPRRPVGLEDLGSLSQVA